MIATARRAIHTPPRSSSAWLAVSKYEPDNHPYSNALLDNQETIIACIPYMMYLQGCNGVKRGGDSLKHIFDLIERLDDDDISPFDILLAACHDTAIETNADQVSIWFFNDTHLALECACFYKKNTDTFTSGQILNAKDYPVYFKTITTEKFLVVPDARNHHATMELTDPYFIDNDIYSLLDFTIHDKLSPTGIICCEKAGEIYHWKESDISILRQVSTLISHYLDHNNLSYRLPKTQKIAQ